jgi:hypothetical protein
MARSKGAAIRAAAEAEFVRLAAGGRRIRTLGPPATVELGAAGGARDTTHGAIVKVRNADRSRRRARRASSSLGRLSHGQRRPRASRSASDGFEHLAVSFSPSRKRSRSVGTIGFFHQGRMPNSGRTRDSLITAETSLIARFNSLQGRKKFPVRMRRELARKKLISCPFSLPPRRHQASNRRNSLYFPS